MYLGYPRRNELRLYLCVDIYLPLSERNWRGGRGEVIERCLRLVFCPHPDPLLVFGREGVLIPTPEIPPVYSTNRTQSEALRGSESGGHIQRVARL